MGVSSVEHDCLEDALVDTPLHVAERRLAGSTSKYVASRSTPRRCAVWYSSLVTCASSANIHAHVYSLFLVSLGTEAASSPTSLVVHHVYVAGAMYAYLWPTTV